MANELQGATSGLTGLTTYFVVYNTIGQVWNGSAFATASAANRNAGAIAGTELGTASGVYAANAPAFIAGSYPYLLYKRVGGSPAETDTLIAANDSLEWNGTAAGFVNVGVWNGTAVSTPATAGIPDINVKNINNVAAATPGASGGLLIAGTNAGTTFGSLAITGGMSITAGSGIPALDITAVGSASAVNIAGGSSGNTFGVSISGQTGLKVTGTVGNAVTITGALVASNAGNSLTGISLGSSGMDAVLVESGIAASAALTNDAAAQLTSINARQALALCISPLAGLLSGAGTVSVAIKPGGNPSGNTRVAATVDASGNRTASNIKVPT